MLLLASRAAVATLGLAAVRAGGGDATPPALAREDVGRLPAMGYNTWNDVRCDGVSAARVLALARDLVATGFAARGYSYLNVDDCWQERDLAPNGDLVPDRRAFPDGVKPVADAVHALGLRFGLYGCRGLYTCAFRAGSGGHEVAHARQLHAWGVDYLKYDSCWSPNFFRRGALAGYRRMRDALAAEAPGVLFSLCGWSWWYAAAVSPLEGYHSWRVGADCDEWANVYEVARTMERLAPFAGPGKGYNDPDMLVGTSSGATVKLTPRQSRTQFDLWCVLAAPLLLGTSPGGMNAWDRETYGERRAIAIDQDPLGAQGTVVMSTCPAHAPKDNWWCSPWSMPRDVFEVWTGALRTAAGVAAAAGGGAWLAGRPRGAAAGLLIAAALGGYPVVLESHRPRAAACVQAWAKPLADGGAALLLVNWGDAPAVAECDARCLGRAGVGAGDAPPGGGTWRVRDLRGAGAEEAIDGAVRAELDGGGSRLVKILSKPQGE